MVSAQIGSYSRQLATTWNELTGRQLLRLARLRLAGQEPTPDDLLQVLLQVPPSTWRRLSVAHRVQLRPRAQFLSATAQGVAPLTAQLLPHFNCSWCRYYGPREAFRNLRFDEFIFADSFYLRYLKTGEQRYLDQLVAVLYRPQAAGYAPRSVDYQGDRREPFNEHLLPSRAKTLGRLRANAKLAVLLYYRGCRRLLEERYDYVFTESNQSQATSSGWQEVLHGLAGEVIHLEATAHQSLHNVLRHMNRVLRLNQERADAQRS
jgi:hypothetical protein